MPHDRLEGALAAALGALRDSGRSKGRETVVSGLVPAAGGRGPRITLAGEGDTPFLRMNSNGYLGLATDKAVIAAEESAVRAYGSGPARG